MTTTLHSAPLAVTLAQVSMLDTNYLAAELAPREAGWVSAQEGMCGDAPLLTEGLARLTARHSGIERRTSGAFFINEYGWYVFAAAIAAYLAAGRVPDLTPSNLALRYSTFVWHEDGDSGEAERFDVRFLSGRCAVLPGDPAADHPDVTVLPNIVALREWLRTSLEAHIAPLIERIHVTTGLGKRAQWNLVADDCAALFLHAGQALGDPARGQAEGFAFVKAPGSPLRNPNTGYITLECAGHTETFRARGGCCRYYTLPAGEKCTTCVLRPAAERDQRLQDYLAKKYAQAAVGDS